MPTQFPDDFLLAGSHCLFLDADDALLEFAGNPGVGVVESGLLTLIRRLERACGVALELVSERSIEDLDKLACPYRIKDPIQARTWLTNALPIIQ